MYDAGSELYNNLLETYFDEYYILSDAERKKLKLKYDPKKLFLKTNNNDVSFENEESKESTINLPIMLAQIKAGNNSCKLKNEIRQILYLSYQHIKITEKFYNNLIKSL